jgi:60 kDa SS-A/Ro ribonucleoprotein
MRSVTHLVASELAHAVKGEADTWETKLTQPGAAAESDGGLAEFKKDVWAKLLTSRRIGYFALLRNLRNILATASELTDAAVEVQLIWEGRPLCRPTNQMPFN